MSTTKLPILPWVAVVVFALGLTVFSKWDPYLADSMCWSAIGFILGYLVCRLEASIRELISKERRDHT